MCMAVCQATAGTSEESQVPDTSTAAQENADNEVTEDESSGSMIVVYYSWSENTKSIAKRIAETIGADIYEIRTVKAYPKDGYETLDIAQEERRTGNLPEIVDDLPDLKEYSTVIIGGPIWNAYVSTPLARYLELTDLSEKTVIPFSTSQGSGQSSYLKDFQERVRTAERIGEYKDIQFPANYSSDTFSDEEIDEMLAPWIESNSLVSKSVSGKEVLLNSSDTEYTVQDVRNLCDFLLTKPTEEDLTGKPYDLNGDERWDVFDLCLMKRKVLEQRNMTTEFDFESKTVLLNSGYEMPIIGLGTWTQDDETTEESVYSALKDGYRLIDTAQYYGNETGVGNGVRKAIDEGIVKREDVFVTTKVMPGNYDRAYQSIDESLARLGFDYIDLMLVHQSGSGDEEVYKALCQGVADGKIRSIGISNYYTADEVERVTDGADIKPAVIQNENHLYYQNTELQEYVKQYGTVIESWYPFGGRGHTSESFNNEVIVELAEKYNKTSAQIILRWQVQAGYIAIPGSSNPEHIAENIDIFDFELSESEMQSMTSLNTGQRYENW